MGFDNNEPIEDMSSLLDAINSDIGRRMAEMVDYAIVRLEDHDEVHDCRRENLERCFRQFVRTIREAADTFETEVITSEEFWERILDDLRDDDEDGDNTPYWGGSNEHN